MKQHFFFDLDGTIAESRMPVSRQIKDALNKLPNVYVISGAQRELMEKQLEGVRCKILAQSGNDCDKWKNLLSPSQKARIKKHIRLIEKKFSYDGGLEDRGAQISYSFTGHDVDLNIKKLFDSDKSIRKEVLQKYPFKDEELVAVIAGTTCIDYLKDGKGENLKEYIRGWDKDECIYFGDNLQEGGNDHSVVGVMETTPVTLDTILDVLKEFIN